MSLLPQAAPRRPVPPKVTDSLLPCSRCAALLQHSLVTSQLPVGPSPALVNALCWFVPAQRRPTHAQAAPAHIQGASPPLFAQRVQTAPVHPPAPMPPCRPSSLPHVHVPTSSHCPRSVTPLPSQTPPHDAACFAPKPETPSTPLLSEMSVLLSSSPAWASCAGRFWGSLVFFPATLEMPAALPPLPPSCPGIHTGQHLARCPS